MSKDPSVEEWLANLATDIRVITKQLRAIARKNMPKAYEFIYQDAIGYSVNDSPFDRICYMGPQKKGYVNFGFFFGASLSDPENLLAGEGKRLRHVKVWSVEEAKNPSLAKLIAATWKETTTSIESVHSKGMKIRNRAGYEIC
jgi:hypothetical protein